MNKILRQADKLKVGDLKKYPVWEFENNDEDEMQVRAILRLPAKSLSCRLIGSQVTLANGDKIFGLFGNVDNKNAKINQHFLTLSLDIRGKWFHLARYHDVYYKKHGPVALAKQ